MEVIEAKILVPIIAPYSEEEVRMIPAVDAKGLLKVVGEKELVTLKSTNRDEIRKEVIELCKQYYPHPLSVKLNTTLNRTFLIDKKYYQDDPNGILEVIYFSYSDKGQQILEFIRSKELEWKELVSSRKENDAFPAELAKLRAGHDRRIYSELASRFGVKLPSKSSISDELGAYTTTSEISTRARGGIDPYPLLYDYIEENARFIQKGMDLLYIHTYMDYYFKIYKLVVAYATNNIKYRPTQGFMYPDTEVQV